MVAFTVAGARGGLVPRRPVRPGQRPRGAGEPGRRARRVLPVALLVLGSLRRAGRRRADRRRRRPRRLGLTRPGLSRPRRARGWPAAAGRTPAARPRCRRARRRRRARTPARSSPWVQPRGQSSVSSSRSGNAPISSPASTWASPKDRMPGVSTIQPSRPSCAGSASISAEVEVCRPRPVTALTCPIARSVPGTSALTSVDLPTPLWPTSTLTRPASRDRRSVEVAAAAGHDRWGTPSGR